MRTHEETNRLQRVVCRLAVLECGSRLTRDDKLDVINILVEEGCTIADFMLLDEKPGRWGYTVDPATGFNDSGGQSWHWKLRQTRNDPDAPLFDRLRDKQIEGTTFLGISPGGVDWRAYHDRHDKAAAETMRMRLRALKERAGIGPVIR